MRLGTLVRLHLLQLPDLGEHLVIEPGCRLGFPQSCARDFAGRAGHLEGVRLEVLVGTRSQARNLGAGIEAVRRGVVYYLSVTRGAA